MYHDIRGFSGGHDEETILNFSFEERHLMSNVWPLYTHKAIHFKDAPKQLTSNMVPQIKMMHNNGVSQFAAIPTGLQCNLCLALVLCGGAAGGGCKAYRQPAAQRSWRGRRPDEQQRRISKELSVVLSCRTYFPFISRALHTLHSTYI